MAKQVLHGAPQWVIAQGLSKFWDPINNRLKPGYQQMAGAPQAPAAPPPPPQYNPNDPSLPWNVTSAAQKSAIDRGLGDTLTGLDTNRQQLDYNYGFNAQGGLDLTTNPYSRAKVLQNTYNQRQSGSNNSFSAQGQFYAGSLQNARQANTQNYAQGQAGLQADYSSRIADLLQRRKSAENQAEQQKLGLDAQALQTGIDNPPDVNVPDLAFNNAPTSAPGSQTTLGKSAYLKKLRARTPGSSRDRFRKAYTYSGR